MRKVITVIIAVTVIVLAADILIGVFMNMYRGKHSFKGDFSKLEYLMKRADEDMIVLGSSIAINSLIPAGIEKELYISCFNGGCNGQTMPFFDCMAEIILNRHTPRYLVLSLQPSDLTGSGTGRINLLKPYYGQGYENIDRLLEHDAGKDKWMLKSNMLLYNTVIWRMMLYEFKSFDELGQKGYVPHAIPAYPPSMYEIDGPAAEPSSSKVESLIRIDELCRQKGTELIVFIPPQYVRYAQGTGTESVTDICRRHKIRVIDCLQSEFFLSRPELFYDNSHLNYLGSEAITKLFIADMRGLPE